MTPVLLPCSRSAHDQNVLARRPQLDQDGSHSKREKQASLEGWDGQPGCPPARGTRTIRMCSFDARTRGSTRLPLKRKYGIGRTRAVGVHLARPQGKR